MGLHKEQPVDPRKVLTSFNEGKVIHFDVEKHEYHYGKKRLKSASSFIEEYEDQFDSERMSAMCSGKWGIDQQDILDLWESNGNAASGFGTAIHAVLEHYYTYKEIGAEVQEAGKKGYNAALPNHPFLRELIWSLDEIREDGDSLQEALVSCVKKGLCGLVDDLFIVDRKKKICRIRDYKITFDIEVNKKDLKEPFSYLGANKLAKNFLQLSFYGYLMQLSGWKVEGIDIFNWDGQWHKHTLQGPKLMKTMVLIAGKHS